LRPSALTKILGVVAHPHPLPLFAPDDEHGVPVADVENGQAIGLDRAVGQRHEVDQQLHGLVGPRRQLAWGTLFNQ